MKLNREQVIEDEMYEVCKDAVQFNLPDKIDLLGRNVDIVQVNNRGRLNGDTCSGACSPYYQRIWLDVDGRGYDAVGADLIHEIVELVNDYNNLKMDHQTITTLSTALHQILRDNKLVFHG